MRTDRDTTRIVRSWLEEGRTALPDHILDAVLDQVPATRQRRSWWPAWRFVDMNTYAKLAIGVAAVAVVAVVGINLLPAGSGLVGSGPTVTPSPSPSPSPSPFTSPPPALNGLLLDAGTYRLAESEFTLRPFTFTVPDGWRRDDGNYVAKGLAADAFDGSGVTMATWIVSHVYADSCHWEGTLQPTGTLTELETALQSQSGHETTGPTAANLGGLPASRFELSLPADFDKISCDSGFTRLWPDAGPNEAHALPIFPGQTVTVYVVDVGSGPAQLIVAGWTERSPAADVAELKQVIESIQFE